MSQGFLDGFSHDFMVMDQQAGADPEFWQQKLAPVDKSYWSDTSGGSLNWSEDHTLRSLLIQRSAQFTFALIYTHYDRSRLATISWISCAERSDMDAFVPILDGTMMPEGSLISADVALEKIEYFLETNGGRGESADWLDMGILEHWPEP